jgi:hypothetical protein
MQLAVYVGMVHQGERTLADAFRQVGEGHAEEADVANLCQTFAAWCDDDARTVGPLADRYGELGVQEPDRLHADALPGVREGPVGLLGDLQDLLVLATLLHSSWLMVVQAAQGCRDRELLETAQHCAARVERQLGWLTTRLKEAAPQALLVAE